MDEQIRDSSAPLQLKAGVDYQPAPILLRILAYAMDLVASVLITLALYRFVGLFLRSALSGNPFFANTFSQSMFFIGGFGYWVAVPLVMGATPAKMLFRMRIIPEANIPISPKQIILREIIGQILTVLTLGIPDRFQRRSPERSERPPCQNKTCSVHLTPSGIIQGPGSMHGR